MARIPEVPRWFTLGLVLVGAAVGIVILLTGEKPVVEVPAIDNSMRPAIGEETIFTVDTSWLDKPSRDAIVAFVPPGKSGSTSVARVVALEGDSLEVRNRKLFVNGATNKSINKSMSMEAAPKFKCPRDCVYVLIDRSRGSADSSKFGPLPLWRVLGSIGK